MISPRGSLAIQTIAMPADTNPNGDIFGGWIVSQMDLAAGVLAKTISHGRAVTVAINAMTFYKPVKIGNVVSCYVDLIEQGTTSMTIQVEVWAGVFATNNKYRVTEGTFVYVAIDEQGKPRQVLKTA